MSQRFFQGRGTPNLPAPDTQSPVQCVPIHVMVHYLACSNSHRSQKMGVQTPLFCLAADEALPCLSKLVRGEHRIAQVNQHCQVGSLVFHLQVFKWIHKILDMPPNVAVKVKELFWVTEWKKPLLLNLTSTLFSILAASPLPVYRGMTSAWWLTPRDQNSTSELLECS